MFIYVVYFSEQRFAKVVTFWEFQGRNAIGQTRYINGQKAVIIDDYFTYNSANMIAEQVNDMKLRKYLPEYVKEIIEGLA